MGRNLPSPAHRYYTTACCYHTSRDVSNATCYSNGIDYLPNCCILLQVQVKHWPCFDRGASCVCGVALRENNAILIADMCPNDGVRRKDPLYITFYAKDLPDDAVTRASPSGRRFKVSGVANICGT